MGILKVIVTILILLLPIAEIGRFQFENGVSVTINDVGLFVLSGVVFLLLLKKKGKLTNFFLAKPIAVFVLVGLVSLVLNFKNLTLITFFISLLYLVRFVFASSLYVVAKGFNATSKKMLAKIMFISGFVFVGIGYIQYFFYPSLKNLFYLGWDEHLYRMFSSFLDPNFAGAFFVIYFLFSVSFLKDAFEKNDKLKTIVFGFISVATLISVYLTYSRSAFLMLVAGCITYLVLTHKKKLIVYLLVGLIALIFISPKAFQTEGTDFLRVSSSADRIKSSIIAVKIFQDSPIIGTGFNAYRYAQNKLGMNNAYWQTTHSGAGTDNSFLFVLATTGVIGFTSYIYLLYKMLMLAKNNIKNNLAPVLFSCLIGLLINSLFINSLFYIFILEWIWLMCGLIENN